MARIELSDFERPIKKLGEGGFGKVMLQKYLPDEEFYALKYMRKHDAIASKQVDHIIQERDLMKDLKHPFIVNLMGYGKDDHWIIMVMECIFGGELYHHLEKQKKFTEEQAQFYTLSIAMVFEFIHSKKVAHRDIKPENILLCLDGYVKLTDFGLAKRLEKAGERTYTHCGTPQYMAPEVLLNVGHSTAVDWWALGILLYEMIVGQPPFDSRDCMDTYKMILEGRIYFPRYFTKGARSLMKKLVSPNLSKRYGNLKDGAQDVYKHAWFQNLSVEEMLDRQVPPPFKPASNDSTDLSNFGPGGSAKLEAPKTKPIVGRQDPFVGW